MRKKIILGLAALAALALATNTALAAVGVKASYSLNPAKANKTAAVAVSIESSDPAAEQPPIMNRIQIKFPAGGKWNGPKFPKCSINTLNSKGPTGCPSGSKIGTGNGVGYAKPVVTDPVKAKLTIFNGGNVILVYAFPDLGPTFVTPCKIVGGYNLDCQIPPIKTLPSAPDASVGTVKTNNPAKSIRKAGKKLGMVVTPKKCKGSWKSSATFSFTTGEKVVAPFSQKCKK